MTPVPLDVDPGRNEPGSPFYEEPEPPEEYEARMDEAAHEELEEQARIEAEARHVTGQDQ